MSSYHILRCLNDIETGPYPQTTQSAFTGNIRRFLAKALCLSTASQVGLNQTHLNDWYWHKSEVRKMSEIGRKADIRDRKIGDPNWAVSGRPACSLKLFKVRHSTTAPVESFAL